MIEIPDVPQKFVWREVRAFLRKIAVATKTNRPVKGQNTDTKELIGVGTRINAAGGGGDGGSIDVAVGDASGYAAGSGVSAVDGVSKITFDQDNFEIFDAGGGEVIVKLKTCPATCPS